MMAAVTDSQLSDQTGRAETSSVLELALYLQALNRFATHSLALAPGS